MDYNKMRIPHAKYTLFIFNIFICVAIFCLDLHLNADVNISMAYITTIMLSLWLPGIRNILDFAILCSALTFLGFYLTIDNLAIADAITNRGLAIFAIWSTACMAIYYKKAALQIEYSEHRKQAILSNSIEPIIILDAQQKIQSASLSITTFFQWTPEELIGQEIYILIDEQYKEQYRNALSNTIAGKLAHIINTTTEIIGVRKDQTTFPCEISVRKVNILDAGREETIFTIILRDIHERKEHEEQLIWLSSHDGLTGIFNRRYFNETLKKEWYRLARTKTSLSLIMLDIDHFKKYNDALGHQEGDICLQKVATCLQKAMQRTGDFVARYGGEEFVVLMPDTDAIGAYKVAQKLLQEINALNILNQHPDINAPLTMSLGMTTLVPVVNVMAPKMDGDASNFDSHNSIDGASSAESDNTGTTKPYSIGTLIQEADQALYQAKASGGNCIVFFANTY